MLQTDLLPPKKSSFLSEKNVNKQRRKFFFMLRRPSAIISEDRPSSSTISSLLCLNSYHGFCVYIASISGFLKTWRVLLTHFSHLLFSRTFDKLLLQTQEVVATSLTARHRHFCVYIDNALQNSLPELKTSCTATMGLAMTEMHTHWFFSVPFSSCL